MILYESLHAVFQYLLTKLQSSPANLLQFLLLTKRGNFLLMYYISFNQIKNTFEHSLNICCHCSSVSTATGAQLTLIFCHLLTSLKMASRLHKFTKKHQVTGDDWRVKGHDMI